ncbi:MAG: nucleotidyltransferase domain-containing protein [Candidatus Dormibacteraceae bacterium]
MRVFGSVARGEDQPGSDIDLLVDLDLRPNGIIPLIELQDKLQELLGIPVDDVKTRLKDILEAIERITGLPSNSMLPQGLIQAHLAIGSGITPADN